MPDRPRSITSVTTALPFLKRTPASAGRSANANDNEASDETSGVSISAPPGFGLSRSRASPRLYSEKLELLRGGASKDASEVMPLNGGRRRVGFVSSTVLARRMAWPGGCGIVKPELELAVAAAAFRLLLEVDGRGAPGDAGFVSSGIVVNMH